MKSDASDSGRPHGSQQQQSGSADGGRSGEGADSALRQLISETEQQRRERPAEDTFPGVSR